MKVGIFFGGQSREREISFAGGRTVYDNLDKGLFEAIPIFVDSVGNFILLDWEYIYKGTIRDFYPPVSETPPSPNHFQIYIESLENLSEEQTNQLISKVGKRVFPHQFASLFDFAFLTLHGSYGEDGNIQGMLEWYGLPYSGSGILPSSIGINKLVQKELMKQAGFESPIHTTLSRNTWLNEKDITKLFIQFKTQIGLPMVIKSPYQGSSIGVTVLKEDSVIAFEQAVNQSFFIQKIEKNTWESYSISQKITFVRDIIDIRSGIGLPLLANNQTIFHPEALLEFINQYFENNDILVLESLQGENEILIESFVKGKEFSCIVIENDEGNVIALPPTGIIKGNDMFDYRSKYLPGMSRKVTPIDLPSEEIEKIRNSAEDLYKKLNFNVYARLDGFYTEEGKVILNDPNTTSGMLPSSFFFHQAAEIGLNPSKFITFIIRASLVARLKNGKNTTFVHQLLNNLDTQIALLQETKSEKIKVGVIMGGYSSERHISVESGRNIYEKLSSSSKYEPIPVFLTGNDNHFDLYQMPINIMLKDNADDIKEKVLNPENIHPIINKIIAQTASITQKYVGKALFKSEKISFEELANKVDRVFIALHGRPGEDGALQLKLDKVSLPYNGSDATSSKTTINKYETNKKLRENGVLVANHRLVHIEQWYEQPQQIIDEIEANFQYPFIAKPADDGCSSAVKKINNRIELIAFNNLIFRESEELDVNEASKLKLKYKEEFPQKTYYLIEDLISKKDAVHFLEITGGMLTKYQPNGEIEYEVFEPSETLASGEILSLEEKFLAGEGQNITPARFSKNAENQKSISTKVRAELEKVARILNVQGYCRIDAFVRIFEDGRVETIIIEINSLPGMTPATCIFHQCAINQYKPLDFIDNILNFGEKRLELHLEKSA